MLQRDRRRFTEEMIYAKIADIKYIGSTLLLSLSYDQRCLINITGSTFLYFYKSLLTEYLLCLLSQKLIQRTLLTDVQIGTMQHTKLKLISLLAFHFFKLRY